MIVGTAGHIDHGKTTLVKALTGVDTDRLPQEKARGITIELGYAFLPLSGGDSSAVGAPDDVLGFVDVPGHERLVHTMVAGATGIDHALLLVAADDGVMPQTREHAAVLSLLGLSHGTVVITKCDRADEDRLAAVRTQIDELLAATPLAGSPVFEVGALAGIGVDALRAHLISLSRGWRPTDADGRGFRLAIDRHFSLSGVGTVVTGTVHAGRVRVGDELRLVPGERRVRVRSVHAQSRPADSSRAGQRCALGLVGIERDQIERGQWLVAPAIALATDRIDVDLTLWHGEARSLRSGTPLHIHVGAASATGTVALLEGDSLAPGARAMAQLVLRTPVGAWHGDRFLLRDATASRTVAGARVLDPLAPARYRRTPLRMAELQALSRPTAPERFDGLLAVAAHGLDVQRFSTAQGRSLAVATTTTDVGLRHAEGRGDWALGVAQKGEACQRVLAALAQFHAQRPEELGPDAARLRRLAVPRLAEPLWRALLADLQARGAVSLRGAFVHLPAHGVQLSAIETRLAQKVAASLAAAGFDGAWVRDLARDHQESEALMRSTLARLAQAGDLHQVVKDLYYPPATMAALAGLARREAQANAGVVTAARFRDATALGRKRAIQILEYLDRIGLLRRVGDEHRLRADCLLFLGDESSSQAPVAVGATA